MTESSPVIPLVVVKVKEELIIEQQRNMLIIMLLMLLVPFRLSSLRTLLLLLETVHLDYDCVPHAVLKRARKIDVCEGQL